MIRGQKEIQKGLLEYIDAENLPKMYGGTCECPGGCDVASPLTLEFVNYVTRLNAGEDVREELEKLKHQHSQEFVDARSSSGADSVNEDARWR